MHSCLFQPDVYDTQWFLGLTGHHYQNANSCMSLVVLSPSLFCFLEPGDENSYVEQWRTAWFPIWLYETAIVGFYSFMLFKTINIHFPNPNTPVGAVALLTKFMTCSSSSWLRFVLSNLLQLLFEKIVEVTAWFFTILEWLWWESFYIHVCSFAT